MDLTIIFFVIHVFPCVFEAIDFGGILFLNVLFFDSFLLVMNE